MVYLPSYEVVNISLSKKPEWYKTKNPFGTTPCFEHDEKIVRDSSIVCEYVNDAYPGVDLWPEDPYRKAQDKMLLDYFGSKVRLTYMLSCAMSLHSVLSVSFNSYM